MTFGADIPATRHRHHIFPPHDRYHVTISRHVFSVSLPSQVGAQDALMLSPHASPNQPVMVSPACTRCACV